MGGGSDAQGMSVRVRPGARTRRDPRATPSARCSPRAASARACGLPSRILALRRPAGPPRAARAGGGTGGRPASAPGGEARQLAGGRWGAGGTGQEGIAGRGLAGGMGPNGGRRRVSEPLHAAAALADGLT